MPELLTVRAREHDGLHLRVALRLAQLLKQAVQHCRFQAQSERDEVRAAGSSRWQRWQAAAAAAAGSGGGGRQRWRQPCARTRRRERVDGCVVQGDHRHAVFDRQPRRHTCALFLRLWRCVRLQTDDATPASRRRPERTQEKTRIWRPAANDAPPPLARSAKAVGHIGPSRGCPATLERVCGVSQAEAAWLRGRHAPNPLSAVPSRAAAIPQPPPHDDTVHSPGPPMERSLLARCAASKLPATPRSQPETGLRQAACWVQATLARHCRAGLNGHTRLGHTRAPARLRRVAAVNPSHDVGRCHSRRPSRRRANSLQAAGSGGGGGGRAAPSIDLRGGYTCCNLIPQPEFTNSSWTGRPLWLQQPCQAGPSPRAHDHHSPLCSDQAPAQWSTSLSAERQAQRLPSARLARARPRRRCRGAARRCALELS